MIQVSRNYRLGKKITNIMDIHSRALGKKAVAFGFGPYAIISVIPAAFIQNWSIHQCSKFEVFEIEKI